VAPIRGPHFPLGPAVIATQNLGNACGVVTASRILQEKSIVKVGIFLRREPQLGPKACTDQAGLHGVAERLALGQVEGEGKRRDNVG